MVIRSFGAEGYWSMASVSVFFDFIQYNRTAARNVQMEFQFGSGITPAQPDIINFKPGLGDLSLGT